MRSWSNPGVANESLANELEVPRLTRLSHPDVLWPAFSEVFGVPVTFST